MNYFLKKLIMKSKFRNFLIIITALILASILNRINSELVEGCDTKHFLCNNEKCSNYGHCYYNMPSINSHSSIFNATCICSSGYIDTPDALLSEENKKKSWWNTWYS